MSMFIRIRILTRILMNTSMEISLIPMSTATYTIMNTFMHMLIPIHTKVTLGIILIPMKASTDPMNTTTLTMAESPMTMFNRAK